MLVLFFEDRYHTNDSIQLGIEFLQECGGKLYAVCPRGLDSILSTLRNLSYELSLDEHTQSMIRSLFSVRKTRFQAFPIIPIDLDLVHEQDHYTHLIILDDKWECEAMLGMNRFSINVINIDPFLDVFQFDEQYEENEEKYEKIRQIIFGETSDNDGDKSSENFFSNDDDDQEKEQAFDDEQLVNRIGHF
jgi:pre-mRNA-splicing factor CWC22